MSRTQLRYASIAKGMASFGSEARKHDEVKTQICCWDPDRRGSTEGHACVRRWVLLHEVGMMHTTLDWVTY